MFKTILSVVFVTWCLWFLKALTEVTIAGDSCNMLLREPQPLGRFKRAVLTRLA